jgi:hypothetical protein
VGGLEDASAGAGGGIAVVDGELHGGRVGAGGWGDKGRGRGMGKGRRGENARECGGGWRSYTRKVGIGRGGARGLGVTGG